MLLSFIVFGALFIPAAVVCLTCGADKQHKIVGAVVCLLLWVICSVSLYFDRQIKMEAWNDGYCECGTHWELAGVSKGSNTGSTTKYYVCPNCYAEITQ